MDARFSRRLNEWVEIDANEIDQRDFVLSGLLHVLRILPDSEQAARNSGMECLDSSVQDFRKACQIRDLANWNTSGGQKA